MYSTFISSICASMHNHLVEPGVEGRKVTSQVPSPSSCFCCCAIATTHVCHLPLATTLLMLHNMWRCQNLTQINEKNSPPQAMEATIVAASVMVMFLMQQHLPPPFVVATTPMYPPLPPLTTTLQLRKLRQWETSHKQKTTPSQVMEGTIVACNITLPLLLLLLLCIYCYTHVLSSSSSYYYVIVAT